MAVILCVLFMLLSPDGAAALEPVDIEEQLISLIDETSVRQIGGDKVLIELRGRGLRHPVHASDTDGAAAFKWERTRFAAKSLNKNVKDKRAWEYKYDYPLVQRINFSVTGENGIEMRITGERPLKLKKINGMENSDTLSMLLEAVLPRQGERGEIINSREGFLSRSERITLEMRDASPSDAFRALAQLAGVNFIADNSVPSGKLTFSFKDTPFGEVLEYLLLTNGLAHSVKGNTMLVGSFEAVAVASGAYETRAYRIAYADMERAAALAAAIVPRLRAPEIDERTRTLFVTATAGQHREVGALLRGIDHPGRQVMLEARLIEVNKSSKHEIEAMLSAVYNGWIFSYGDPGGRLGYSNANKAGGTTGEGAGASGAAAPAIKLLDSGLRAMELRRKGKILASPSLVSLDGQKAVIKLTRSYLYQSSVDSDGNATLTEQETGPSLEITPRIGRDGFITLKLKISAGEIIGFHKSGMSESPETSKREIDTSVRVRDGELFVIGGLYSDSWNKNVVRVPVLGYVPLIGELFTSRSESRVNSELAFIVVPYILDLPGENMEEGSFSGGAPLAEVIYEGR